MSELQAVVAERVVEKTALDRAWMLARVQKNVERSMQTIAVVDSDGNETSVYQHQPMAANKGLELIGKELGMFKERIEHSGSLGVPIEISSLDPRLLALSDEHLAVQKLKRAIVRSRLWRAERRNDPAAIERALLARWRSDVGEDFYTAYVGRFDRWFRGPHYRLVDALADAVAANPGLDRLVEVGCGDGRALAHLAERLPDLRELVGLDINARIIARNVRVHGDRLRLRFVQADARRSLAEETRDGTILFSYGGVLEYVSEAELAIILARLGRHRDTAVALVEPVDPRHNLTRDAGSHIHGAERSFSHNHLALLVAAGFTIGLPRSSPSTASADDDPRHREPADRAPGSLTAYTPLRFNVNARSGQREPRPEPTPGGTVALSPRPREGRRPSGYEFTHLPVNRWEFWIFTDAVSRHGTRRVSGPSCPRFLPKGPHRLLQTGRS